MDNYCDKKLRFWCQKVLPLVYDDSLSYYELLCKVVDNLNQTNEATSELISALVAPYSPSISYKIGDYVWYNDQLWKCTNDNYGGFNPADWGSNAVIFTEAVGQDVQTFKELVNGIMDSQNSLIERTIEGIAEKYDVTSSYTAGKYVSYATDAGAVIYKCTADAVAGITPANTDYWEAVVVVDELTEHIETLWENFFNNYTRTWGIVNSLGNSIADAISQKAATDKFNDIDDNIDDLTEIVDAIHERTENRYGGGDVSTYDETAGHGIIKSYAFNPPLPAGTYTLSCIVKVNSAGYDRGRIYLCKAGGLVQAGVVFYDNGTRQSGTITVEQPVTSVAFYPGVGSSQQYDVEYIDVQIEEGDEATFYSPPLTAVDFLLRSYTDELTEGIYEDALLLNSITEETANMWDKGNVNTDASVTVIPFDPPLPAGTYSISCKATTNDTSDPRARIWFRKAGGLGQANVIVACDNTRQSGTVTVQEAITSIAFYPGLSSDSGFSVYYSEIQLETGAVVTPYKRHITAIDFTAREKENNTIYALNDWIGTHTNITLTKEIKYNANGNAPYIVCLDAKYTKTSDSVENPHYRTIVKNENNVDRQSMIYTVGGNGKFEYKEFRTIAYPWYSKNMKLRITVPENCTLEIRNAYIKPAEYFSVNSGIEFVAHDGDCDIAPQQTLPAFKAAKLNGFKKAIIIPKISTKGILYAYHDDYYDPSTTKLRTAAGERPPATYEGVNLVGKWMHEVPWSLLETLYTGRIGSYGQLFRDEKLMLLDDFLKYCATNSISPVFSIHPYAQMIIDNNTTKLYNLVKKYNLLSELTIKCGITYDETTEQYLTGNLSLYYSVFGNEIKQYTLDAETSYTTEEQLSAVINAFDSYPTMTTVKCAEFYANQIISISGSTPNFTPIATLAETKGIKLGCVENGLRTAEEIEDIINYGVTEFTSVYQTSNGLMWL